jgi:hypothetical protein
LNPYRDTNLMTPATDRIQACADMFERRCREAGVFLSGDLRVGEVDAANLLGVAAGTLKNLRQEGKGPTAYTRGVNGGRLSYRLIDLASWVEIGREDW